MLIISHTGPAPVWPLVRKDKAWPMPTIGFDIEVMKGFFYVALKRFEDGKTICFEKSHRSQIDLDRLRRIIMGNTMVGFNSQAYDMPMLFLALKGVTNAELKDASDRIIKTRIKPWHVERELGIKIPKSIDHMDLFDCNPSVGKGLKTLNGRLHGTRLQELPYHPDSDLTDEMMDNLADYCLNSDIPATELLFNKLKEPLALRVAIGAGLDMDVRSKSDAQIGENIVKKRVEALTGRRIKRLEEFDDHFGYDIPPWMRFETKQMQDVLDLVGRTTFWMGADCKAQFPPEFKNLKIQIGSTNYTIGIGGLHSTEAHRALYSDDEYVLVDADVASQYPSIIMKLGLYPKAVGPVFLQVYGGIIKDRLAAKAAKDKVKDQSGKIALNGVYGKLGSPYSFLFAPHLMLAVTLTGQLSLLMLIERAEAAGISVVSGNTDGVVFKVPRAWFEGIGTEGENKDRLLGGKLKEITDWWEAATSFKLEFAEYEAIYNASVNEYMAVKAGGKIKLKGKTLGNPWLDNDLYNCMKKNPSMTICSEAVGEFLTKGVPIEETIRACRDIRKFVTVVNVTGGGTWCDEYLGKVVRFIWAHDGMPILYRQPHEKTGNFKRVSKTEGCRPLMDLPDQFPTDIDYAHYVDEANQILENIGWTQPISSYEQFVDRLMKPVPLTVYERFLERAGVRA